MHDDPAREGLEHLQAAARELIAAARSMLDVAERLVDDPAVASRFISLLGALAAAVTRPLAPEEGAGEDLDRDGTNRVERIRVS